MKRLNGIILTLALLTAGAMTALAQSCPDNNHPHAIDMGLKVKWACCNLDSKSPTKQGYNYAWGETEIKGVFNYNNYKYGGNEHEPNSCKPIGKSIEGGQYDVAKKRWGGSWRMPTKKDFMELVNKCDISWVTEGGVNGVRFTAPNGNSIFIGAFGYVKGYEIIGRESGGSIGCYWTANCSEDDNRYAVAGWADLEQRDYDLTDSKISRAWGAQIRPVSSGTTTNPSGGNTPSNSGLVFAAGTENLHYKILKNNTVEVTGEVRGMHSGRLVIPSTVKHNNVEYKVVRIGKGALSHQNGLTEVVVPASVVEIGDKAFANCEKLEAINIAGTLSKFGRYVTSYCPKLRTINISGASRIKAAGNCVYDKTRMELLAGCGASAIAANEGLTIVEGAFTGTSITHAIIKGNKCKIKGKAFANCSQLKLVDVYASTWSCATNAFSGCWHMKALRLKNPPKKAKKLENTSAVIKKF